MKKVYTICLLLIAACFFNTSYAQVNAEGRMGKEGGPYWILGLNAGGAWQDSDIKSSPGAGWGFYLGRSIMHNPQNPISADLRFRYMGTLTYGQNAADSDYGNANLAKSFNYLDSSAFAHNHETELHDLSLEARINFEELRRKSRIMLSLYGGVGLGIHDTWFDQLDFDGSEYDYNSAITATEEATINANEALRDGIYETNAHDDGAQLSLTPSIGAELGYWFSPHFALSLGHRTTFPLTDRLDGISGTNAGSDIHHYTSLNLHWRINEGNSSSTSTTPCPRTEFNLPVRNNATLTTSSSSVFISASISNVKNNQITYTVNNQRSYNFTYNEQSDEFRANLPLIVGENIVSIMAKNSCGISSEYIKVVYQPQTNVVKNPPVIQFTNPVSSPYNTTSPLFVAMANITNISSSSQLTFQVNGQAQNFTFNNGTLVSNEFTLSAGLNTIRITATNQDGSDVETSTVILENSTPPVQLPDVIITSPSSNPFTTTSSAVGISATISNVSSRNDVQVQVNGQVYTAFTFDGFNLSINNLSLDPGSTTVIIQGSNSAGTDMETQVIIHTPQTQQPPLITFVDPVSSPYTVSDPTLNFTTNILNISGASQISYQINGVQSSNFSFTGTTFRSNGIQLNEGPNYLVITAFNSAGQDTKTMVVNYEKIVPQPVITMIEPGSNPYTNTSDLMDIQADILHVNNRSQISCTFNGISIQSFTFNGTSFEMKNVRLDQGSNTLVITATNTAGVASETQIILYNPVVVQKPIVQITFPTTNPFSTAQSSVNLVASIQHIDNANQVSVLHNGKVVTNFTYKAGMLVLSNIALDQGSNTFVVTATNSAGSDTKSTIVIYTPPIRRPVVQITNPAIDPLNTSAATINLTAVTQNIDLPTQVKVFHNGNSVSNFTFANNIVSLSSFTLVSGTNNFEVRVQNDFGQANDQTVVIYQAPIPGPTVDIKSPASSPWTSPVDKVNITAIAKNVASKADITFTKNGVSLSSFNFNGNAIVANNVPLVSGQNTFVITVRNASGQATDQTVVIYNKPVVVSPPVVTIISPVNGSTLSSSKVTLNAVVTNVSSKNGVSVKLNGQSVNGFQLMGAKVTANNLTLSPGSNVITVTGRNSAGQDTKSTTVIYQAPVPGPTVDIKSPASSPWTSPVDKVNITAIAKNVASKADITFTKNGVSLSSFNFNGNAIVANNVPLVSGQNTFVITVRNASGQATDQTVVIYNKPVVVSPPVVTIISPVNGSTLSSSKVTLNAVVTNVSSKNGVSVKLNGQSVNGFQLSGTSVTAKNLTLNPGSNVITVTGRNSAGQDTKSTTVIYQAPVPGPTVDIKSPASNPWTSPVNKVNITAIAKNVTSKSDITFTKNGVPMTNFNFNGNAIVANNVSLVVGQNTFVITVRNGSGQSSDQVTVVYTGKVNGNSLNNGNSNSSVTPPNPSGTAGSGTSQGQGSVGNGGGNNEGGKGKGKGKGGGK